MGEHGDTFDQMRHVHDIECDHGRTETACELCDDLDAIFGSGHREHVRRAQGGNDV